MNHVTRKIHDGKKRLLLHVRTAVRERFLPAAALEPMDKAFLWIIYGCRLRREEALALTRFDISLERRILTVNKALVFDGNNPCLKGTKSENGVRELPVPRYLAEFLRGYLSSLSGTYLFSCRGRGRQKCRRKPLTKI